MTNPLAIVAGVGPGIGAALARRFAAEGFRVALVARDEARISAIADEIARAGGVAVPYSADLSDHAAIRRVVGAIVRDHGRATVLAWNAAVWAESPALALEPDAFDRELRLGLTGALTAIRAVAPAMSVGGGGTILMTGGGLALAPQYGGAVPALTAVKSGLRGFVHAAAPEFAAIGIRLATVTIAGQVAPGGPFDPDRIAEAFWNAHAAPAAQVETVFSGA